MTISDRKAARLCGLVMLVVPALIVLLMSVDGVIEWQIRRDNPIGNTVALLATGVTALTGVCLLLFPSMKNGSWQRRMVGVAVLLYALEHPTSLLRKDYLDRPPNLLWVLAVVFTFVMTAFFVAIGVGLLKKKSEPAAS